MAPNAPADPTREDQVGIVVVVGLLLVIVAAGVAAVVALCAGLFVPQPGVGSAGQAAAVCAAVAVAVVGCLGVRGMVDRGV
jgi:hypothetical protein